MYPLDIIGGPRGLLEGLNNIVVTSFASNFDDSVTKICTSDTHSTSGCGDQARWSQDEGCR